MSQAWQVGALLLVRPAGGDTTDPAQPGQAEEFVPVAEAWPAAVAPQQAAQMVEGDRVQADLKRQWRGAAYAVTA